VARTKRKTTKEIKNKGTNQSELETKTERRMSKNTDLLKNIEVSSNKQKRLLERKKLRFHLRA